MAVVVSSPQELRFRFSARADSASFYINLPIGGVSAALVLFFFQTPKKAKPVPATLKEKILQMDLPGTFILMAAFVCLILVLQWGGVTKSWGSSDVIGCLVGFGLLIALFVGVQIWQGERALIVPRLIKQRTIWLLCMFQITNMGGFLELLYYLPIYFQVVSGVSAADSGVRNLPYIIGCVSRSHRPASQGADILIGSLHDRLRYCHHHHRPLH